MTKMRDRTSSDNKDLPLSHMEELVTREEEKIGSDTKCISIVDKWIYITDSGSLFPFYIPKPQSLISRYFNLNLLMYYQIFSTLKHIFYYTNCFIYDFEQYESF